MNYQKPLRREERSPFEHRAPANYYLLEDLRNMLACTLERDINLCDLHFAELHQDNPHNNISESAKNLTTYMGIFCRQHLQLTYAKIS